jgi:hypothetical protein
MKNFSQRSCSVSTSSDDRGGEVAGQDGVEKMDQQSAVALGPEQGLEDAVDLGVDGVFHEQSLADGPTTDQTRRVRRPTPESHMQALHQFRLRK